MNFQVFITLPAVGSEVEDRIIARLARMKYRVEVLSTGGKQNDTCPSTFFALELCPLLQPSNMDPKSSLEEVFEDIKDVMCFHGICYHSLVLNGIAGQLWVGSNFTFEDLSEEDLDWELPVKELPSALAQEESELAEIIPIDRNKFSKSESMEAIASE